MAMLETPSNVTSDLARALLRLTQKQCVEEREIFHLFLNEAAQSRGLATYGEEKGRTALEEGAVKILLLSESLESLRITGKCSFCGYERQLTLENQVQAKLRQNSLRTHCPKCKTAFLGVTEIQSLAENFIELAERSSAEVRVISVKTEEGQTLKNSYKGVAAILRS